MEKSRRKSKGLKGYYLIAIIVFVLFVGGSTITYFALNSKGKTTEIPKVVGLTFEEAKEKLEKVNLKVEKIEEDSQEVEKNHVIRQDPKYLENYEVREKSTVKVYVSTKIDKVTVPKVIGLSQEQAIKKLEKSNLKYTVIEETSKKIEKGYVMKQSIDENTTVDKGTTITITVSK